MEQALVLSALVLGLASSMHCLGMCGPIAFSLGLKADQPISFTLKNLSYQLGRVFTYSLLGLLMGVIGKGFSFAGLHQYVSLVAGVLMIFMVIFPSHRLPKSFRFSFLSRLLIKIKSSLGVFLRKRTYGALLISGLLNGLLPCGAVYIALTASLAAGSLIGSASFMMLFGLGTIPMMFAAVLVGNVVTVSIRNKITKALPVLLFVMGTLFILRGLDLGIPYLSPTLQALELNATESCCHP